MATSYLLLFVLIIAFFSLVLPKLVESIQIFLNSINGYMLNIQMWINEQEWLAPLFTSLHLENLDLSNFSDLIKGALNGVVNTLTTAVPQLLTITSNIISIVVTGFLSIIFSVYMLSGKATLLSQCRRVLKAYAPPKVEAWVTDVVHLTASTFTAFVSGQLIEACILGGLTALGMLFIQADYAPLIGVIVGATALIPMVGAFLAARWPLCCWSWSPL